MRPISLGDIAQIIWQLGHLGGSGGIREWPTWRFAHMRELPPAPVLK
jgi:hypothetical protein